MEKLLSKKKYNVLREMGVTDEMFLRWFNDVKTIPYDGRDRMGLSFRLGDNIPCVLGWWPGNKTSIEKMKAKAVYIVIITDLKKLK
jgi:hypothetical protein